MSVYNDHASVPSYSLKQVAVNPDHASALIGTVGLKSMNFQHESGKETSMFEPGNSTLTAKLELTPEHAPLGLNLASFINSACFELMPAAGGGICA